MAARGNKPGRARPAAPFAHDGIILRALRLRQMGARSGAELARELTKRTNYSVLRGHIIAIEKGRRVMPDDLVEACARLFSVPTRLFPEYTSRHVTAEQVTHPLVAWALVAYQKMSSADARKLISKVEGIRGSYDLLVSEMLRQEGIPAPELPRIKELQTV